MQYTLSDIEKIKSLNNNYIINDDVIEIINSISEKVSAPSYVKTPIFHKKKQDDRKKKKKNLEINDDDWVAIRNFQATEKIKKDGIDKLIDTIRCELNKISDKHYEKQKNRILELMSELTKNEYSDEDKNKVVALIFEIASNNKFYSKLYAQLYKDLIYFYSCMTDVLDKHIDEYKGLFKNIDYCDPDKDYERYCKNNKLNESRHALTSFVVNLQKIEVISIEITYDMIKYLIEITREMINDETKKNILCEITENLFILVTESKDNIKKWNSDNYDELNEFISNMKVLKVKSKPGLCNKMIFKYMDLHDNLNKS
tara:strand:+ start:175 stop:1116 length:942 start_codon:yes stop_codon:yes gene_type:complete